MPRAFLGDRAIITASYILADWLIQFIRHLEMLSNVVEVKFLRQNRSSSLLDRLQRYRPKLKNVSPISCLLFLLSCYIVASRLGPFVAKAGRFAVDTFELESRIVETFDEEGLVFFREAFGKFSVVTRAPYYPLVSFGR